MPHGDAVTDAPQPSSATLLKLLTSAAEYNVAFPASTHTSGSAETQHVQDGPTLAPPLPSTPNPICLDPAPASAPVPAALPAVTAAPRPTNATPPVIDPSLQPATPAYAKRDFEILIKLQAKSKAGARKKAKAEAG